MRLGFGINEHRQDEGGLFKGAGVSAAETLFALAAVVIFAPIVAFLVILMLVRLWPLGDEILGSLIILSLIGAAGMWFRSLHLHNTVELEGKRNKYRVVHETDQGFGYVLGEDVRGYSHGLNQGQLTPFNPNGVVIAELPEPEPPDIPATFADMVSRGLLGTGADFILGFDKETGEAIRIPELTSLGIGGRQGSGKTVSTLYLMLQAIVKYNGRVRFLVIDPHALVPGDQSLTAKVGGLAPFFLMPEDIRTTVPADDTDYHVLLDAITDADNPVRCCGSLYGWMRVVDTEMLRRIGGKRGDTWVIIADEFKSVMESPEAEYVATVLRRINEQARKVGMFAILSSINWKGTSTGGTEIRDSVVTFLLHNMPESISKLIVPSVAKETPTLAVGEAIFWSRDAGRRGKVPMTTAQDAAALVEYYRPHMAANSYTIEDAAKTTVHLVAGSSDVDLVRHLFGEGLSEPDIAKKLCRCNHGTGLSEAKLRVREILKGLIQ